ncbi:GNAT family N-acetyltransferase [Mucilaginibacter terrae]|uniref:GNAT family N-acetyltransferase n=1 Tax=Mucilaginibacter terrae TaxID=1955052 RepID=UPI00362B6F44
MCVILETERLVLRQFSITDAPFITQLLNSPKWLEFIGDRQIKTIANAQNYLVNGPLLSYKTTAFGLYLVQLKDSSKPIGMCGLVKRDYLNDLDLGYALLPQFEGNGYAYEIASATVIYAFENLHLLRLAAITTTYNLRSVHLLEKMGFVFKYVLNNEAANGLMLFIRDA